LLFDRLRLGGAGKKRHRKPIHNVMSPDIAKNQLRKGIGVRFGCIWTLPRVAGDCTRSGARDVPVPQRVRPGLARAKTSVAFAAPWLLRAGTSRAPGAVFEFSRAI
jgi:hypothetical protein